MKKTYLKIHDNNKKSSTGGGAISWEYYDTFYNIFDSNKSVAMNNVLSSMTENNKVINPDRQKLSFLSRTILSIGI